jgi:GAF domain-containing protein
MVDGELIRLASIHGVTKEGVEAVRSVHPMPVDSETLIARAIRSRAVVHVRDVLADPHYGVKDAARASGWRGALAVPMLREGHVIGGIFVARPTPGFFTDAQGELLKTFADQAVIAIENTRLFEEVQARTRELTESLEYQTATSDVLGVISRSPSDAQPVFEAIAGSAMRLCDGALGVVTRFDGELVHLTAHTHITAEGSEAIRQFFPMRPGRSGINGRIILERRLIHIPDVCADTEYSASLRDALHLRSALGVPMFRDGRVIGTVAVGRFELRPFTEKEFALLQTFADQAVIAIENARLFEEVQARTRELQESLEYQTAIGEVLNVIGRSPNDLQPVLDVIVETAGHLCHADNAHVFRLKGGKHHLAACNETSTEALEYLTQNLIEPGQRGSVTARAVLERRTIHVPDAMADPDYGRSPLILGTILSVPLLRDSGPVGAITVSRKIVRPFTEKQIELVTTFADQALIAINNVGLFEAVQARTRELAHSVEGLRALGEVTQAVNSTLDLETVLSTIVAKAVQLSGTEAGVIYVFDELEHAFHLRATYGLSEQLIAAIREQYGGVSDAIRQATLSGKPQQIADLRDEPPSPVREIAMRTGFRARLIVPLIDADKVVGALVVRRKRPGEFSKSTIELLQTFASQSVIAIQNARLFQEIEDKSRQLEIASMSHELRTPLAAMLGYAELLKEGIYGALPDKSTPIVTRIQSNGKHLLGLINTVLDISKIEAGQFKLNLAEYALASVIETVRVATESLAAGKKLAFKTDVARDLPRGLGDEQRLTQVLLNLVGNAIKFTDAGEVRIAAAAANSHFALSVSDTGPGIPPQERDRIFEKFHRIDSSITKAKGGTGLGLAIAKQIVDMHGGRIWVESTLGRGSIFRMELPVRATVAGGSQ